MPPTQTATVLVQRCEIRKTRKGENFASLRVNLGEAKHFTSLDAKIWQSDRLTQSGRSLPAEGTVIEAVYKADEYRGAPQWTIEDFRVLEDEERQEALQNFVPTSEIDEPFYRAKLEQLLEQADPERVSAQILFQIFDRPDFREAFYRAPAAQSHHQNYPGGLLEHTLNVTCIALSIANSYAPGEAGGGLTANSERPYIDRTLLIAAGLLHDIGKIDTYRFSPLAEVTDADKFEGHLSISYSLVRELARPLREAPPYEGAVDELDKLLNCILSHHGQLEYGSPVLPVCAEAIVLSLADLTDARLSSIVTESVSRRRQDPNVRWIRHPHYPRGIFVGDWPLPEPEA